MSLIRVTVAALLVVILGTAACTAEQDQPSAASTENFTGNLRAVHYDYEPVSTPLELAAQADLVVLGSLESAVEGRSVAMAPGEPASLFNVVFTVEVEEVVKGDETQLTDDRVYVEVERAAYLDVADFQKALPAGQVLLFLDDRTELDASSTVINNFAGRPAESRIFTPFVQGFWLSGDGRLIGGYEDLQANPPGWHGVTDLEDLLGVLRSAS